MSKTPPTPQELLAALAQQEQNVTTLRQDLTVSQRERDGLRVTLELIEMALVRGNTAEALKLIESTYFDT